MGVRAFVDLCYYLQPWDYAAAEYFRESLGYRVVTLSGKLLIFKPDSHDHDALEMQEIPVYIYRKEELKCNLKKDLLKNERPTRR